MGAAIQEQPDILADDTRLTDKLHQLAGTRHCSTAGSDDGPAFGEPRPVDPITAAQQRAGILAEIRRDRKDDLRIRAVFEADPVIAEYPATGNLVTRTMLDARLDLLDTVLDMLERPALTRAARSRIGFTLKGAFGVLSDDAQVEWALSEVRLEEVKAFLASRSATERATLSRQITTMAEQADLWVAARTLSMAAHLGVGRERGAAALSNLLEQREA